MTKETLPILKKRQVFDIINESKLLREFSVYGCEETPGKIFGYNPFSGKCVDITDYDGPERVEPKVSKTVDAPVVPGGEDSERKKPISDAISDPRESARLLKDIYLGAFDADQIIECYEQNKLFSILGMFYGKTAVRLLPKMVELSAKAAYSKFTPSGKAAKELSTYISQRKPVKTGVLDELFGFTKKGFETSKTIFKVVWTFTKLKTLATGLTYGAGAYWVANKYKDYDLIGSKAAGGFVDWVDNKVWGEGSWDSWKCFCNAAVLAVSIGLVGRKGPKMLMDITKATVKMSSGLTKMIASPVFRRFMKNSFEKAIRNVKSKQIPLFQALAAAGKLPSGAKIILDKSAGAGTLKLTGLTRPISIAADTLPKEFQKFAKDGKIIIDPKVINDDLARVSEEVGDIVNKSLDEQATAFSNSDFYKRLKALRAAAKETGTTSPGAIRAKSLENSSKILDNLGSSVEEAMTRVDELGKLLIKKEYDVKQTIESLRDVYGISFDNLRKLASGKKSNEEVVEMLNTRYPGLKEQSPDNFKKISDYFSASREYTSIQKQLVTDIELSRKALLDETGIFDAFKSKNKINDVEDWLQSPSGQMYKSAWSGNSFKKASSLASNKYIIPELKNVLKTLASPVGIASIGLTNLVTGLYDQLEKLDLPKIKTVNAGDIQDSVMKSFDELSLENFFEKGKVKTEEFLDSVFNPSKLLSLAVEEEFIEVFTKVIKNPESIKEIEKALNQKDPGEEIGKEQVRSRLKNIVFTILKRTIEKETNEVKKMSNKDIRQLVAEVLNENYGKYPYHANEPSEEEPDEDYSVEWKTLVDEVCNNKKKNLDGDPNTFEDVTIEVAKILVKDQDLFRDVLELAGANKSVGVEIMQQLKTAREKKSIDKKNNV